LRVRRLFARPEAFALAATGYRALTRLGLVIGSSEPDEISGAAMPHGFLKGMSGVQARAGLAALARVDEDNRGRRAIAALYDEALSAMNLQPPIAPRHALHTYLKYPIRVRERDRLLERAATAGIALSDWFCSPVHPVRSGWERWGYETGSNPVAEELSRSIVNLPTQPGVTAGYARRVLAFLRKHRAWL